ncbi:MULTISPECIES: Uma2 family endonuclease [Calothrix]|uniref:Uma2 family endonuclease n=2 Tax=Calothrix TaxID=1186 RepID=A0ABR8AFP1_9CYAN|nr:MULTISPECIES: Uma2 family endonuclease [Calothrix]MBD2198857.1 Uma2 family endonuclease [Calothrix parietina FACHB-288]MBD2227568.1 Uma2 family endonuclease [Calothrix anomala FACHB-343]
MQTTPVRWTTADLELFAGDRKNRYEIIDGELFVTRSPHWEHQAVCINIGTVLKIWSDETGLGQPAIAPGIIFSDADNVIPDVVWASNERLESLLDEAGHLTGAPELVVEVLSPGEKNEKRDRESKLKLYSVQGVQEYWICDRIQKKVEVYRREQAILKLAYTLFSEDELTSPLLPGFRCLVSKFF